MDENFGVPLRFTTPQRSFATPRTNAAFGMPDLDMMGSNLASADAAMSDRSKDVQRVLEPTGPGPFTQSAKMFRYTPPIYDMGE